MVNTKIIKALSYVTIATQFVLVAVLVFLVKEDTPIVELSPVASLYVGTFDILITLVLIYVMAKWFKMPLLRRMVLGDTTEVGAALQKMTVLRLSLWEVLMAGNAVLWTICGVENGMYIVAILAIFSVFLIPTDGGIQRNIEDLQN